MQRLNGSDQEVFPPVVAMENRPIRQLVKAKDVATKLGWFSTPPANANPICRPSKWVMAGVPCASTPTMWKGLSKSADVSLDNAQDTQTGENVRTPAMDIREAPTLFRPAESFVLDSQNEVRPSLKPFRSHGSIDSLNTVLYNHEVVAGKTGAGGR